MGNEHGLVSVAVAGDSTGLQCFDSSNGAVACPPAANTGVVTVYYAPHDLIYSYNVRDGSFMASADAIGTYPTMILYSASNCGGGGPYLQSGASARQYVSNQLTYSLIGQDGVYHLHVLSRSYGYSQQLNMQSYRDHSGICQNFVQPVSDYVWTMTPTLPTIPSLGISVGNPVPAGFVVSL